LINSDHFKENIMLESNLNAVKSDMKTLVADALQLLNSAADLTGEKAEEVRQRGMQMLDEALQKANEAQACAMVVGKEMAASADGYVKANPWRTVLAAASVGLLAGVILGRK
jgi:ElaB/YqjD/DUF883 family membrane-anchored ribosome-binding protein